jgi:hypothetical protein
LLPRLPSFTEANSCVTRDDQPMHVVARVRDIAEMYCERRHQFRVGFEFVTILTSVSSVDSIPFK